MALEIGHFSYYAVISFFAVGTGNEKFDDFMNELMDFVQYGTTQDDMRKRTIKTLSKQSNIFQTQLTKRQGATKDRIQRLFAVHWIKDSVYNLDHAPFSQEQVFSDPDTQISLEMVLSASNIQSPTNRIWETGMLGF